ncbi:MAG: rRNA maturation RNAse YbeY, partial [Clostridia bacterium]|nr:rRNA maturation RNAse YbeY [Clostridia bacterium]
MTGNIVIEWAVPEVGGTEEVLQKAFEACMTAEGITLPAYAQLMITTDEEIHRLNREYRHVDRATDVLSFPSTAAHPGYTLGEHQNLLRREMDDTGACFLGDIIIS